MESNRRPRDWQSLALTNWATLAREVQIYTHMYIYTHAYVNECTRRPAQRIFMKISYYTRIGPCRIKKWSRLPPTKPHTFYFVSSTLTDLIFKHNFPAKNTYLCPSAEKRSLHTTLSCIWVTARLFVPISGRFNHLAVLIRPLCGLISWNKEHKYRRNLRNTTVEN